MMELFPDLAAFVLAHKQSSASDYGGEKRSNISLCVTVCLLLVVFWFPLNPKHNPKLTKPLD